MKLQNMKVQDVPPGPPTCLGLKFRWAGNKPAAGAVGVAMGGKDLETERKDGSRGECSDDGPQQ
eukprot:167619-Chlamydomonas_euryale.AAC.2